MEVHDDVAAKSFRVIYLFFTFFHTAYIPATFHHTEDISSLHLLEEGAPSLPFLIRDTVITVIVAPSLATLIQETAITITVIPAPSLATSIQEMAIFHAENASFDLSLDGFPL